MLFHIFSLKSYLIIAIAVLSFKFAYFMKKAFLFIYRVVTLKSRGSISYLILLLFFIPKMVLLSSCANIIPPTGGPRDTLPPVLIDALPRDSMVNFTAKKIVLNFNEYVQLDNNMNDNLIVSPYPVNLPIVESKLRTVTVVLRDSLKPNTTYSINFGKGVKDVNESNIARNLTYVFSTGDHIDNGMLSGNVIMAENGKRDSTLLVLLHNNLNDTSIRKNSPTYITRLDSSGNFRFRYIAPGTYNVFVLTNDYSKKYDDSTKVFAFLDAPVAIDSSNQPVKLYAYREVVPTEKKQTAATTNNKKKPAPKDLPKLKLTSNVGSGPQDLLSPLVLTLSSRIGSFDSSKIVLSDTNFVPLKGYSFSPDTSLINFMLYYNWPENTMYKLVIQKDAFKDTFGTALEKNDTLTFKTKRESEYGSVRLHFNGLDLSKNPVLQLIQADKITNSITLTSNEWYQRLFKPGDYEIRILFDKNKNGVWDPGNYNKKLQPEIVIVIPRKLTLKSNIDNDTEVNL